MIVALTGPIGCGKSTEWRRLLAAEKAAGRAVFGYATAWEDPRRRGEGVLLLRDVGRPEAAPVLLGTKGVISADALLEAATEALRRGTAEVAGRGAVLGIDELGVFEGRASAKRQAAFAAALRAALAAAGDAYVVVQERALERWQAALPGAAVRRLGGR